MYVSDLSIRNIRVFAETRLTFVHPETRATDGPRLRNVNLLPGDNGAGKTSVLSRRRAGATRRCAPILGLPALSVDPSYSGNDVGGGPGEDAPCRRRALVTIDFFELDTREHLLFGRAEQITRICMARELLRVRPGEPHAREVLTHALSPASAHTTCGRAFDGLCSSDPDTARRFYEEAAHYLERATTG